MKKIGVELAKTAKEKGICQDWYDELLNTHEVDKLAEMYLNGIDFCLSNEFPSNNYLRRFKGKIEQYGIHVDGDIKAVNIRKVVALGQSNGLVEVDGFHVCEVFVKHDSEIVIHASDRSFVVVDVFDTSRLVVSATGDSKVLVNMYGGEVITNKYENAVIKVREKNQKTY